MVAGPDLRRHLEGRNAMKTATLAAMPAKRLTPDSWKGLLLTGTAPGEPGVGGVILKDLIRHTGTSRWNCCWLAMNQGPQQPYWSELATTVCQRRYESGYRPLPGIVGEVVSAAAMRVLRAQLVESITSRLLQACRNIQPDFLLAVLDCPTVIEVARRFLKVQAVPVRCIVWDDLDLVCRHGRFDRWTQSRLARAYGEVLQHSERVAVICENMQTEYKRRYGIESMVLRHGVAPLSLSSSPETSREDVYRIGFAGSITAPDCMRTLVAALDTAGWRIHGKEVVLRLLGARFTLDSRQPQRIEYFGWRSVEETCARLSECDLQYLPQSFAEYNRTFSTLSFPTKLSTYVTARKPILLHAPEYASLTSFWTQHVMGPVCDQCCSERLRTVVTEALSADFTQQNRWKAAIATAHELALGIRQFEDRVEHFVAPIL